MPAHPRPARSPRGALVARLGWRSRALVVLLTLVAVVAVTVVGRAAASDPPQDPAADAAGGANVAGAAGGARGPKVSGLPWASGAFSHEAARTVAFEQARGRRVDILTVFPTRDSWSTILEDWWMSPSAVPAGFEGTLAVGVPLFPTDGSMAAAARGDDDAHWEELGRLIASRYPDAFVRPGWEMNIPNWPWAADPSNVEEYKAAFRHASTALKKGGPGLRVTFNVNEGAGPRLPDARLAYPGDDAVDDIGLDAYDWDPPYSGGGWERRRAQDQGWDFWAEFARAHGKTFSVPEWGVIPGGDNSGGDDPEYITAVLTWMGEHADLMSYDTYFEETAEYCRCALSLNPRAQEAYAAMMPRLAALTGASAGASATGAATPFAATPSTATSSTATPAATAGEESAAPAPSAESAGALSTEGPAGTLPEQEPAETPPAEGPAGSLPAEGSAGTAGALPGEEAAGALPGEDGRAAGAGDPPAPNRLPGRGSPEHARPPGERTLGAVAPPEVTR